MATVVSSNALKTRHCPSRTKKAVDHRLRQAVSAYITFFVARAFYIPGFSRFTSFFVFSPPARRLSLISCNRACARLSLPGD